jgi:hypothetical protein
MTWIRYTLARKLLKTIVKPTDSVKTLPAQFSWLARMIPLYRLMQPRMKAARKTGLETFENGAIAI